MENLPVILISTILVNNYVLTMFVGLCPFFGVSTKTSNAFKMGLAVMFVTTFTAIISWPIYTWVLVPTKTEYLQVVVFITVVGFLVQVVELFLKNKIPSLYNAFGIYLPLIITNCVVLAAILVSAQNNYSFVASVVNSIGVGTGYTLAILIMSGVRERLDVADVPEYFKGVPIAFITAALLALSFMAFGGMIK